MNFEPVSIIGMSCYLPGANSYQGFWDNLLGEAIHYKHPTKKNDGESRPEKGMLEMAEYFEPGNYGISEKEAKLMDPQLRKFLELVDMALQDAGYKKGEGLANVGVIASQGSNHTYHNELTKQVARGQSEAPDLLLENVNKGADFLATRVSYTFNFNGPSYNLQSACSSSLNALVEACYLLQSGRCDVVICGGINISYPLEEGYDYQSGSIYSKSGYCKPFDKDADGTIPSNGGGVLVLKRSSDATAHGDKSHGRIIAAGSNNDGRKKVSYAAPSAEGQFELLKNVYQQASLNPHQLAFVECHATGTVVGDPIEVRSLQRLMKEYPAADCLPVKLSSVKGEIGHLFWAAGIAATIKSLLALQYKTLPATKNLATINPLLELGTSLEISDSNIELDSRQCQYAAVSCFGVGGTNAHVVLSAEGAREMPASPGKVNAGKRLSLISEGEVVQVSKSVVASSLSPLTLDGLVKIYRRALEDELIEADSDYFDHYGDSMTSVKIIADLKKFHGVEIDQDAIFNHPTAGELFAMVDARATESTPVSTDTPANSGAIASFNKFQQRFYLLEKLNRSITSQYNVAICFDIDSHFPKLAFTEALQAVLSQIPLVSSEVKLGVNGLQPGNRREKLVDEVIQNAEGSAELMAAVQDLFGRKFNLETGPVCLLGFVCDKLSGDERLVLSMHHLYLDGKGLDNLLHAVEQKMSFPETPLTNFINQNNAFQQKQASLGYWRSMSDKLAATQLPFANTLDRLAIPEPAMERRNWDELLPLIREASARKSVTPFNLVFALFLEFLSDHNSHEYLCVGTTLVNREPGSQSISCQINNVPVIVENRRYVVSELLKQTTAAIHEAISHSDASYDEIAKQVGHTGKPLYNLLLMFQNQNKGYAINVNGRSYPESELRYNPMYTDACLNFTIADNNMVCEISYDRNIYSEVNMAEIAAMFEKQVKKNLLNLVEDLA